MVESRDYLIEQSKRYGKEGGAGHAVVPYEVDKDKGRIYVYDSNNPDSKKQWIEICLENGNWEWKYDASWLPENAIGRYIKITPIDTLYNEGKSPIPIGASKENKSTFYFNGNANLSLRNFNISLKS